MTYRTAAASMITIHHLGMSQSERIVWLAEELGVPYNLVIHKRDPMLSPPSLRDIPGNTLGTAPVIVDGDTTLAESAAIAEWLIHKHGNGRFATKSTDANYADYLYWFHFANANLQSGIGRNMAIGMAGLPTDNKVRKTQLDKLMKTVKAVDIRLSKSEYLAGNELSAADIMSIFSLTTMRYFLPFSLKEYPNILRWIGLCTSRDAYKKAMEKGDKGMPLLLTADAPAKPVYEEPIKYNS